MRVPRQTMTGNDWPKAKSSPTLPKTSRRKFPCVFWLQNFFVRRIKDREPPLATTYKREPSNQTLRIFSAQELESLIIL
jgi:hypothetical protein